MSACILLPWADARAEDPTPSATVTSDCGGGGGGEVCVEDPDCGDPLPDQEQTRNSWGPSPAIDLGTPPCAPTGPTLVCVGSTGHSYSISGHSDLDTYTPQKRTRSGSYDGDCVWHWGAWSGWANDGSPQQAGDSTDVTAWHTTGGSITSAGVLTAPTAPGTISITATIDDAPASVSPPDVGTRDDSPVTSAALAVTVVAVTDLLVPGATEIPDGDTDDVNTKAYVIAKSDTAGATLVTTAVPSSGPPLPGCWGFTGGTAVGDGLLQRSIPLDQPGAYTLDVTCGASFKKAVVYVVDLELDGDSNHDGVVDDVDHNDHSDEAAPGLFVPTNGDDDNDNDVPDVAEGASGSENDLVALSLDGLPAGLASGKVIIEATGSAAGRLKVWRDSTKTTLLIDMAGGDTTEEFTLGASSNLGAIPASPCVEGLAGSSDVGDVTIEARYEATDGTVICTDKLICTIIAIDEIHSVAETDMQIVRISSGGPITTVSSTSSASSSSAVLPLPYRKDDEGGFLMSLKVCPPEAVDDGTGSDGGDNSGFNDPPPSSEAPYVFGVDFEGDCSDGELTVVFPREGPYILEYEREDSAGGRTTTHRLVLVDADSFNSGGTTAKNVQKLRFFERKNADLVLIADNTDAPTDRAKESYGPGGYVLFKKAKDIKDALDAAANKARIIIIDHSGFPGYMKLGTDSLDINQPSTYPTFDLLTAAFRENGVQYLTIISCDVGRGTDGAEFLNRLVNDGDLEKARAPTENVNNAKRQADGKILWYHKNGGRFRVSDGTLPE